MAHKVDKEELENLLMDMKQNKEQLQASLDTMNDLYSPFLKVDV